MHAAIVKRSRLDPTLFWPEKLDALPSEDAAFWFPVVCGAVIAWTDSAGALYRVQTKDSRNEIRDVGRSVQGVVGVVQHNIDFLRANGSSPDPEQCAHLVRVFENNYRLALTRGVRPAANIALLEAKAWLERATASSPAIVVRKALGIRLFNLVRHGVI